MSCSRRHFCLSLLASGLSAPAAAAAAAQSGEDLDPLLEPVRRRHGLPALGAAVVLGGQVAALGAVGYRKLGDPTPVTHGDHWLLGSCTKSMTATLIGVLVEEKRLRWDSTLGEVFPEFAGTMHRDWQGVTPVHLLSHRAGLPEGPWPGWDRFVAATGRLPDSLLERRRGYAASVLRQPPLWPPGSKYLYANLGYTVAAAMAEKVAAEGVVWEGLMRRKLFEPLGMQSAGFGLPGVPGRVEQPWQHRMIGGRVTPIEPGTEESDPFRVTGPAFKVHCSLSDWARYAVLHLRGARGQHTRLLYTSTLRKLHVPTFGGDYALGWQVRERSWAGGKALEHSGNIGYNRAQMWIAPARDFAVLVATNAGIAAWDDTASKACDETVSAVIGRFLGRRRR